MSASITPIPDQETQIRFERFQSFLKTDPNNISLRLQTIELAIKCQAWDLANQIIQDGLEIFPDNIDLHAHAGMISLKNQQYLLACEQFEFAVSRSNPVDPAILYNYAFALFYSAQYEKAHSILEQTPVDDSLRKSVHVLSARSLHHLGKREEAVEILNQLSIDELDEEAEGVLALLLYELEKSTEALKAANHVLALNPLQLDALLARASIEAESEDFDAARVDYTTATNAHPTCGRAWSGLGQIDLRDFQFDKAQADLETAVKYMPNHIGTWHMLAWIHIMNNRADEAKYAFDRSYEIDRNFGETHGGLAVVAAMQQQRKLAEQCIRRASKLNPDGFAVYYAQLLLLQSEGKQDEAKALYDRVMTTTKLPSGETPGDLVKQRLAELSSQKNKTIH